MKFSVIISLFIRVCELSYRYFVKYENMEAEWKQMLQDSGINEDLELGMENGSGFKGQKYILNVINIFFFRLFELLSILPKCYK